MQGNNHLLYITNGTMMHPLTCESEISFLCCVSFTVTLFMFHSLPLRQITHSWSVPCNFVVCNCLVPNKWVWWCLWYFGALRARSTSWEKSRETGDEMERIKRRSVTAAGKWEQEKREMVSFHHPRRLHLSGHGGDVGKEKNKII